MPVPQIISIPEDALLLGRDDFAIKTNTRQLRMQKASIRDDPAPEDNPWLALANMRIGESFVFRNGRDEVRWTLKALGDQAALENDRGERIKLDPLSSSPKVQAFYRNLADLLLGRHHGVDAGDLGRAIERDPIMLHRRYVELAVRAGLPVTSAALADYPDLQVPVRPRAAVEQAA